MARAGQVSSDTLDDLVEEWHTTNTGLPMAEFIAGRVGWTPEDVRRWVADGRYRP